MALTLAEANQIVQGAVAKAEELNIKINVAVFDGVKPAPDDRGGIAMPGHTMRGEILQMISSKDFRPGT